MKIIKSNSYKIKVDDRDYKDLIKYHWSIFQKKCTAYAYRKEHFYKGGKRFSKTIRMHRQIMNILGRKVLIDHKDLDGLNNQRKNLRLCSPADNCRNKKPRGKSGIKGVSKTKNGWQVVITIGTYKSKTEAAKAYNDAAKRYH